MRAAGKFAALLGLAALVASFAAAAQVYYGAVPRPDGNYQGVVVPWGAPGDRPVPADYDGDGRADFAVFRPHEGGDEGIWYVLRSGDGGVTRRQWGSATLGDVPVPADYDGDGRTDFAVWRPAPGAWYILRSSDGQVVHRILGAGTDSPVPADYDGDARADPAVWSAGTWTIAASAGGLVTVQLGQAGDIAVPADYDGDARADAAVFRPGTGRWLVLDSGTGTARNVHLGEAGDVPVTADWDGDGRADFTVWRRTGAWLIVTQAGGIGLRLLGGGNDVPVPRDFDGDRRADRFVYRP